MSAVIGHSTKATAILERLTALGCGQCQLDLSGPSRLMTCELRKVCVASSNRENISHRRPSLAGTVTEVTERLIRWAQLA
jgi:hypothetical protein